MIRWFPFSSVQGVGQPGGSTSWLVAFVPSCKTWFPAITEQSAFCQITAEPLELCFSPIKV